MISPQALNYLLQGHDLIITQSQAAASSTVEQLQAGSADVAFVIAQRGDIESQLLDVLSKVSLSSIATVVYTSDFKNGFELIDQQRIYFIDELAVFGQTHHFKPFIKKGKNITILPPLSALRGEPDIKRRFWEEVLKPLQTL